MKPTFQRKLRRKAGKQRRVVAKSYYPKASAVKLNRSQNWPYGVNYQAARDKAIDNGAEVQHRFVR